MARMIQGNLAYKEVHKEQEVVYAQRKTKTVKAVIPAKEKLLYLFAIIFCVVVTGAVIFNHAQIYEINMRIHQQEAELQALYKENQSLKLEVRQLQEPKRLLEEGRKLGFAAPEEDVVSLVAPYKLESAFDVSKLAVQK